MATDAGTASGEAPPPAMTPATVPVRNWSYRSHSSFLDSFGWPPRGHARPERRAYASRCASGWGNRKVLIEGQDCERREWSDAIGAKFESPSRTKGPSLSRALAEVFVIVAFDLPCHQDPGGSQDQNGKQDSRGEADRWFGDVNNQTTHNETDFRKQHDLTQRLRLVLLRGSSF